MPPERRCGLKNAHANCITTRARMTHRADARSTTSSRAGPKKGIIMRKILILLILAGAGYQGWNKLSPVFNKTEPLYDAPYIIVYGRNACGYTQSTLKELRKAGVPFEYQIVDDRSVADLLHSRMESSGIDTRRYNLPVVDVSNKLSIRPAPGSILDAYSASSI